MSRLASAPIKTYTIGFEDSGFNETPYARRVAEQFGTEHTEQILAMDALDVIEDIAWYLDEPLGDSSVIPTYMVSKLAAKDVKVSLSADGGDELFAGYDKYVVENRERNYRFIPSPLRSGLGHIGRALPDSARGFPAADRGKCADLLSLRHPRREPPVLRDLRDQELLPAALAPGVVERELERAG